MGAELEGGSLAEFERISEEVFHLGKKVKELPFCDLKVRNRHEYGKLKV